MQLPQTGVDLPDAPLHLGRGAVREQKRRLVALQEGEPRLESLPRLRRAARIAFGLERGRGGNRSDHHDGLQEPRQRQRDDEHATAPRERVREWSRDRARPFSIECRTGRARSASRIRRGGPASTGVVSVPGSPVGR